MSSRLDRFLDELQEKIFDEAKEALGESGFQRWMNPVFRNKMQNPDGHASVTGSCGDTMEIFLKFGDGRVIDAGYQTNGCASSSICGSVACEMAIGRNPDELLDVTGAAILRKLEKLPKEDEHCAFLSAETLSKALDIYMKKQM